MSLYSYDQFFRIYKFISLTFFSFHRTFSLFNLHESNHNQLLDFSLNGLVPLSRKLIKLNCVYLFNLARTTTRKVKPTTFNQKHLPNFSAVFLDAQSQIHFKYVLMSMFINVYKYLLSFMLALRCVILISVSEMINIDMFTYLC